MPPRDEFRLFEGYVDRPCAVPECKDTWTIYYSSTRKVERREEIKRKEEEIMREQRNFCFKHNHIAQVPSPSNPHLSTTYVVVARPKPGHGHFPNARLYPTLVPVDDPVNGKSLHHTVGPGYYLYEDELPFNARVTFSVHVEIPEEIPEATVDLENM